MMMMYPAYTRPPKKRIRNDSFSTRIGMVERRPGRFFEDLSEEEFSASVDVALRDLRYAIIGRFQGCGGSDPLPTILGHVSGMKTNISAASRHRRLSGTRRLISTPRIDSTGHRSRAPGQDPSSSQARRGRCSCLAAIV